MSLHRLLEDWLTSQNVNPEELFKVSGCFIAYKMTHQSSLLIMNVKNFTFAGRRMGCSLLIDDGALAWLIANSNNTSSSTRRHIELALCHLAQNGKLPTTLRH
jgi:hypothetical protein